MWKLAVADWALVVGSCLFGVFAAVVGFFYLPLHIGAVPMPISILGIGALCWLLPRVCYRLTGSLIAAAVPALLIFAVVVVLLILPNALFNLPLRVIALRVDPPSTGDDWRNYVLLAVVAITSAAAVGLLWGDKMAAVARAGSPAVARAGSPAGSPEQSVTATTPGPVDAPPAGLSGDTGNADKG
jgi:hypothetical protein